MIKFEGDSLLRLSQHVSDDARAEFTEYVQEHSSIGHQIWGIPSGASQIYGRLEPGDHWLLLDSPRYGGGIQYVGRVDFKVSGKQFLLSKELWTEARFPHIFLMHGQMVFFPWEKFLKHFSYNENYDPRGHILGIARNRFRDSSTKSEIDFVHYLTDECAPWIDEG